MTRESFAFTSRFMATTAEVCGIPQEVVARRVRDLFFGITKRVNPTITLEIGAFEAGFSVWAREHLPEARTLAFEANPDVFQRFRESVSTAGVEYVNACVGPENGPVHLNVPEDFCGVPRDTVNRMASLHKNLQTGSHRTVTVDGIRLDDFVKSAAGDRLVAWIDVEGALEMVLSGSRATLEQASAVYVEVESEPMWEGQWLDVDVAAWFAEIGMVPIARDNQRPYQYNVLFVSAELAADPVIAKMAARIYLPVAKPVEEARPTAPAPLPPPVPRSKLGRLQGLAQRTLRAQNEQLRAQNEELRREVKRLRQRTRNLRRRLDALDLEL